MRFIRQSADNLGKAETDHAGQKIGISPRGFRRTAPAPEFKGRHREEKETDYLD